MKRECVRRKDEWMDGCRGMEWMPNDEMKEKKSKRRIQKQQQQHEK